MNENRWLLLVAVAGLGVLLWRTVEGVQVERFQERQIDSIRKDRSSEIALYQAKAASLYIEVEDLRYDVDQSRKQREEEHARLLKREAAQDKLNNYLIAIVTGDKHGPQH